MKRLIFRAFDGEQIRYDITGFEHGQYNEMAGVFIDGDYYKIVEKINKEDNSFHLPAVVDQFTGLHDKNGVKIFERDVVKLYYSDWLNKVETILYRRGSFGYGSDYVFTPFNCLQADMVNGDSFTVAIEVVGNIHQNPELLLRG